MLEETLSGIGAMHCTNGIVIQRSVGTCAEKPGDKEVTFSKKRISIFRYCYTVQRKEVTQKLFH